MIYIYAHIDSFNDTALINLWNASNTTGSKMLRPWRFNPPKNGPGKDIIIV